MKASEPPLQNINTRLVAKMTFLLRLNELSARCDLHLLPN